MIGRVVSNKTHKTATVLVTGTKTHPLYKKSYVRSKKYLVHDETGVNVGDLVEILEVSPISKRKHWKITKVVGREFEAVAKEHLKEVAKEEVMPASPDGSQGGPEEKEELDKEKQEKNKENSKKEIVVDDSTVKTKSKKGLRTKSSTTISFLEFSLF